MTRRTEHRRNNDDEINMPQPIRVKANGDFIELIKQDVVIVRIGLDDMDSWLSAARMLNGMCRAGIIFGEMEQMRDIINMVIREANDKV